ncbi:MAG: PilZ domain-containing protein [Phycisphaerae bacterium]
MLPASDRRRFARVPMSGSMRWQSGAFTGEAEVLDISPSGAGFLVAHRSADKLNDGLLLEIELEPGRVWRVTESAQIVQRIPLPQAYRFGVSFSDGDADWIS